MGKNKKSYAKTLPILAISFAIFIGILGALIINQQISLVAEKQEKYLGNTLGLQLAKVAKTSIINKDILSLQIELDDMLAIDGVGYVAVYDASKKVLAKAKGAIKKNNSDKINLVLLKKIEYPIINGEYKKNILAEFLKYELRN